MESPNLSQGQMTPYQLYLRSEHWQLLRGAKLQVSPKCERCDSKQEIEVHHKLYRASWYDARLGDLQTLCHHCHIMEHAKEWEVMPQPVVAAPVPEKKEPVVISREASIAALRRAIGRAERRKKPPLARIERNKRRLAQLLAA
jgi:hypothetical protein